MCQCQGKGDGHGQHQHQHHHQHRHQQGHGGQCGCGHQPQQLTTQEKLLRLRLYAERLQSEVKAVEQQIKELEAQDK